MPECVAPYGQASGVSNKYFTMQKKLERTNTLAYFVLASKTKKTSFIAFKPHLIQLFRSKSKVIGSILTTYLSSPFGGQL
jgi:hypothetical protein